MTRFAVDFSSVRAFSAAAVIWMLSPLLVSAEAQPDPIVRIRTFESPRALSIASTQPNRAVIGVSLSTGARDDTLGLEITDVTPDGPAAKAGLVAGLRIEAINGVSLRISADDAADPLTADAGYRRLQRELNRATAGDAVELRVRDGGQVRTVNVTTVSSQALMRSNATGLASSVRGLRGEVESRASLGLALSSAGNARDTLGVFITRVTTDGPAAKAGIEEGQRIAAINGVELRVPREDADDPRAGMARVARLTRELEKAAPGDRVTLRVYSEGRYRDVAVTADNASSVGGNSYFFELPRGSWAPSAVPATPASPVSPATPAYPAYRASPTSPAAPTYPASPVAPARAYPARPERVPAVPGTPTLRSEYPQPLRAAPAPRARPALAGVVRIRSAI